MLTCEHDESENLATKVGLPGKSGIGGAIVAVLPRKFSVATWSPRLNEKFKARMSGTTHNQMGGNL